MFFRLAACAVGALVLSSPVSAEPNVSSALDEAIAKTRSMAFRADKVDWPALEAQMRSAAANATDLVDLLAAYEILVEGLGDGHSFVNASAEDRAAFRTRYGREYDGLRPYRSTSSAFRGRRVPEMRSIEIGRGNIAHLVTVPMKQGGGSQGAAYATTLFKNVAAGSSASCGYIVDLRGNQGGNVWLMVAGLSPLLGEGWRSYELDRNGKTTSAGYLKRGAAIAGEGEYASQTIVSVDGWQPYPRLAKAPVAVLIDDAVGSSGEGVAVAFKGRPRTRFFGQTTYGAASSNEGFLIGERVNIVVTTGMMADRKGHIYPDGVPPDQQVMAGDGSLGDPDDAVVEAAKDWLATTKACAKA